MNKITLLPKWVFPSTIPSVYDTESGTCLEMTAKVYGAMRELQEGYKEFVEEINKAITEFIEKTNQDQEEFENKINKIMHDYIIKIDEKIKIQDKQIEDTITYIKENISEAISSIIVEMRENGELSDVILEGLTGIEETLEVINTTIENMTTRISDLENNFSETIIETNAKIAELENKTIIFGYDEVTKTLNIAYKEVE